MKYNPTSVYKRVDNVLYQDDVAIIRFHSKFIDLETMLPGVVQYMEKYIKMFPDLVDVLEDPSTPRILGVLHEVVESEIHKPRTITVEKITLPEPKEDGTIDYSESASEMVQATIAIESIHAVKIDEKHIKSATLLGVESHDPNSSRLDQVRYWISRGVTSPSIIASTIDANPSYVQRLVSQIKKEQQ